MATATKATAAKTQGVIKCLAKTATTNWKTHTFSSSKVDWVVLKNVGTESIRISWDNDDKDAATNPKYYTISPGEVTPTFGITKDTQLHYKRDSGTGGQRLECIAWG